MIKNPLVIITEDTFTTICELKMYSSIFSYSQNMNILQPFVWAINSIGQ